ISGRSSFYYVVRFHFLGGPQPRSHPTVVVPGGSNLMFAQRGAQPHPAPLDGILSLLWPRALSQRSAGCLRRSPARRMKLLHTRVGFPLQNCRFGIAQPATRYVFWRCSSFRLRVAWSSDIYGL